MNRLRELTLSGYAEALKDNKAAEVVKAKASKEALMNRIEHLMLFGGAHMETVTMDTQALSTPLWAALRDLNGDGIDDDWQ